MSTQDRLAAIIAQHQWYVSPSPGARGYCLNCLGQPIPVGGTPTAAEFSTFSEYATHLAAAITAADNLAVIETPSVEVYRDGGEWMTDGADGVGSVLPVGVKDWEIDEIEGQLAEAIAQVRAVRAARTAEAGDAS